MGLPWCKRVRLANAGAQVVRQYTAQAKCPYAIPGSAEKIPTVWPITSSHLNAGILPTIDANANGIAPPFGTGSPPRLWRRAATNRRLRQRWDPRTSAP
jgi:hypothetical protein